MQPSNGLIGDATGTELPQMADTQHEEALNELKKKAKYSRSKEFAELRANMESRIEFYQQYLPTGNPVAALSTEEAGKYFVIANLVIAELKQVIDGYQSAADLLKEENER